MVALTAAPARAAEAAAGAAAAPAAAPAAAGRGDYGPAAAATVAAGRRRQPRAPRPHPSLLLRHAGGELRHAGGELRHAGGELRHAGGELRHAGGELRHAGGELRHAGGELRHAGGELRPFAQAGSSDGVPYRTARILAAPASPARPWGSKGGVTADRVEFLRTNVSKLGHGLRMSKSHVSEIFQKIPLCFSQPCLGVTVKTRVDSMQKDTMTRPDTITFSIVGRRRTTLPVLLSLVLSPAADDALPLPCRAGNIFFFESIPGAFLAREEARGRLPQVL
eukprot:gene12561-biopygen1795